MKIAHKLLTIYFALLLFAVFAANAQISKKYNPIDNKPFRFDKNVRTGKLANGFTYFIRRNTQPKNRVVLYLANKVGSILEDEDQQGLAHFTEHMSFDGTKHYPKNKLVDYLQKSGVRFGADLNAYTSFDETVYQLPLPSDDKVLLNNGLQIMRDWAQNALLDSIDINKERGIVLEEKRLRKGVQERLRQQTFPAMVNQSRYAVRMPIGMDTILENFKPAAIRRYYHDWYRPDLQALIVVGDIDVNQMELAIKKRFSDLKNPLHKRPRTDYTVGLTGKNQFVIATDKEKTATFIKVTIKHKSITIRTPHDYHLSNLQALFNTMLGGRIEELNAQPLPPFTNAFAGTENIIRGVDAYSTGLTAKPGELEAGFKSVWRETIKFKRYGFTQTELDRAKLSLLNGAEASFKARNKVDSKSYVQEYLEYFLNGTASPGIVAEYAFINKDIAGIKLKDVNKLAKDYITENNRDIVIEAPEKDKAKLPDEATVLDWMKFVEAEQITPFRDNVLTTPLLTVLPVPGKITGEKRLSSVNATELILSNGLKVILKPTTFRDNLISFTSFAPGGTSLANDDDYQSASDAAGFIVASGLGDFNAVQLDKYLTGKRLVVSPYIAERYGGISGGSSVNDFETALQMVYLYFTQPRIDITKFKNGMADSRLAITNRYTNPDNVFSDTVNAIINDHNMRRTGPSLVKLNTVSSAKCLDFFIKRFADASGFTFTFVGNFDEARIKPLLEKYLGSLPSTYRNEKAVDLKIVPSDGFISKTVYKGREQRATVLLRLTSGYDYNKYNNEILNSLGEVMQIRLLERLRKTESGVYSPACAIYYDKEPVPRCTLSISFSCSPANVDKLITASLDELNKIRIDGPQLVDIEKYKAEDRRSYENQLVSDNFWLYYISGHIYNGEDLNEVNEYNKISDSVTQTSIKEIAGKYFNGKNLMKFVLMPEGIQP